MSTMYMIKDERTKFCREAMKGNGGTWNPLTEAWMFTDLSEHGNALCELYRATRPTVAMCEALEIMIADGTGAQAWGFDPAKRNIVPKKLDRDEASKMLGAGYAVRRMFGVHPLEDTEAQPEEVAFDTSEFEHHAEARRARRKRSAA
jgi:hypothetical protein